MQLFETINPSKYFSALEDLFICQVICIYLYRTDSSRWGQNANADVASGSLFFFRPLVVADSRCALIARSRTVPGVVRTRTSFSGRRAPLKRNHSCNEWPRVAGSLFIVRQFVSLLRRSSLLVRMLVLPRHYSLFLFLVFAFWDFPRFLFILFYEQYTATWKTYFMIWNSGITHTMCDSVSMKN